MSAAVEQEAQPTERAPAPERVPRPAWLAWFTAERVVNSLAPVVLLAMALAPLEKVYLDAGLFGAMAGGLLLGTAVAVVGAVRRWPTLTVLALAVPVFFLCGALAAPSTALGWVLPTPTTWRVMGQGVVTVWKQVLTIAPPLGTGGGLLLLPYLLSFVGALVAVTVSLRARHPSLSLIPPAVVLVICILFGTRLPVLAGVLGVVGVLVCVGWVARRAGRLELNRVLAVSIVLGIAAVGGTAVSTFVTPSHPRVVLRDLVEPPPDPHDYPSPLAGFRTYVDGLAAETLFTMIGLPAGTQRIRLATMDSYSGTVWDVTGGNGPGTGAFTRSGDRISVEVPDDAATVEVTVGRYSGVWVPNVGHTLDVDFTSQRREDLTDSMYYNTVTDTGLVTAGLRPGDAVTMVAQPPTPDVETAPTGLVIDDIPLPEPRNVPDVIGSLASQYSEGASAPYARVEAIASALSTRGFFSHGLVGEVPSRPGHGAARLVTMLDGDQIVGDSEQYAAAMALMVRALGMPARVVMGFEVPAGSDPGTAQVTGDDVPAWVEVPFEGRGWLPFFPTPKEDQIPQSEDPDPQDRPQPQVLQPPPPPQEPPDVPPQDRDEADVEDEDVSQDQGTPQWVVITAAVGLPLLVLASPFLVIAALKARRRKRRMRTGAPVQRIAGGWEELEDRAVDLGASRSAGHTRREKAGTLDERFLGARTLTLARRADAGVFAPEDPDDAEVQAYWSDVGATVTGLQQSVPRRQRIHARFSLRSLRKKMGQ